MLTEKLLEYSLLGVEWVLWLLVGLSVLSVAVMVDRWVFFFRTRERIEELEPGLRGAFATGDFAQAAALSEGDSFVRNVLRSGLESLNSGVRELAALEQIMLGAVAKERVRYDARLTVLATIGNNAPCLDICSRAC